MDRKMPVEGFLVLLLCLGSALGSCNYNPSDFGFEDDMLLHSTALNSTDTRFRLFVDITLLDCEKECGLRPPCTAYNYHRIMHLCELHAGDADEFESFLVERPNSVYRRITGEIRITILGECGMQECPAGTTCTCSDEGNTCSITECVRPPTPKNVIILGNMHSVGSKVSSVCERGYAPVSDVGVSRVCQTNGKWSGTDPVCGKACAPLTAPDNGTVIGNIRNVSPDLAQYQCNEGHVLEGPTVVECQISGEWNDTAVPSCTFIDCGSVTSPADGNVVTLSGTAFGSVANYECNDGFDLTGESVRSCLEIGQWSDSEPSCVIKDCGSLEKPKEGSVVTSSGTTFGSLANYECNNGFDLVGESLRSCLGTGQWSDFAPTCAIKDCGSLVSPAEGAVVTLSGTTFGSLANYECNDGFDLVGASVRSCLGTGQWSDSAPTCVIRDCGSLVSPADGTVVTPTGTTFGSLANYSCNDGFDLSGESVRSCLQTGQWSDAAPTCVIKDSPADGNVELPGTTVGSMAYYACNAGFDLTGVSVRSCLDTGQWSESAPTCVIKDCGSLVSPADGTVVTPSGTTFGSLANYACNDGFDLVGESVRSCLDTGQWSDSVPTCEIKDCGSLKPPEGGSVVTPFETTFDSVANYECNDGFDLTGVSVRTCLETGLWSDSAPTCAIKDCGSLLPPEDGRRLPQSPGTTFGSVANYECNVGFDLVGEPVRNCLQTGQLSDSAPTCVKIATMFQSCSSNSDCKEPNSECRSGTCGCEMGYSYLPGHAECISACASFGTSFQTFEQYYLYEHNDRAINGYTLQQCKLACIDKENCSSADYDSSENVCYLSVESASTQPGAMIVETRQIKTLYLHRDCACPGINNECSGCGVRPGVPNATLYDMILPDGAMLGTETGVKLVYLCLFLNHMNGNTQITSECGVDGEWTNIEAGCQYESQSQICNIDSDCLEANSECRLGFCVCKIFFSYLRPSFTCVEVCEEFGNTFQHVENHFLDTDNFDTYLDIDIDGCESACLNIQNDFPGVVCQSAEYEAQTRSCRVYAVSATSLPQLLVYDTTVNYTYLHRDCACPQENTICGGCLDKGPVANATLTEIYLPDGAVWGTEPDVVRVYTCKDGFHHFGSKSIKSECESGLWDSRAIWTNDYEECRAESMFQPCVNAWECIEEKSECRSQTCGCQLGYSYFPANYACINSECPVYGSTFQEFETTRITSPDIANLEQSTVEECKKACLSAHQVYGTECKSFDYHESSVRCYLKAESAITSPDSIMAARFTHYHRDCALES